MSAFLEIIKSATLVEEKLLESEGEITEEISSLIAFNEDALPEKIDSYAFIIDRMRMNQSFYKQKAEMFQLLAKKHELIADKLESNIEIGIRNLNREEVCGFDYKFKLIKSNPAVLIDNEDQLEEAYKFTSVKIVPDKKRIAEDLKAGVPVLGAKLIQNYHVKRYLNTPKKKLEKKE